MVLVTATKPAESAIGGGIAFAASGTTLPTTATAALAAAFKNFGYISTDGVSRSIDISSETIRAWGGDVVAVLKNEKTETFTFRMLESDNVDALALIFGTASGTLQSGITVQSEMPDNTDYVFAITMALRDGYVERLVIPKGVITSIGEINYVDNDVVGFELTITAMADSTGVTCYEYVAKPATT